MRRILTVHLPRGFRLACALSGAVLLGTGCREDAAGPGEAEAGLEPALASAAGALPFRQISVGNSHTCAVTTDDQAYCWGHNGSQGTLGVGDNAELDENGNSPRPMAVVGGLQFRFVSAGTGFTCGLTTGDLAYCWGTNSVGQLGDGTRTSRNRPVAVAGKRRFRQIRSGGAHTCAVTFADEAFCWGDNSSGQLGDGTGHGPLKPVRVTGGLKFRGVFAGVAHTCGRTPGGKAYCWGDNDYGQLGDGSSTQRLAPVAVKGGRVFSQLSAGLFHSCGVSAAQAYCWGRNRYGALGDGTFTRRSTPTAVAGGLSFAGVSAGREGSCGVTTGNKAYCWGYNHSGRLGTGTENDVRTTPAAVVGDLAFESVSTSMQWFFTCGITTGQRAYCWGNNSVGQLGDGTTNTTRPSPVAVVGPS